MSGKGLMIDLELPFLSEHTGLLCDSYRHWTGSELVVSGRDARETARALFEAPFAVVSHDTRSDPVFTYGNRLALGLFEMDWVEFTTLPSRLSAEPVNQLERSRLLAEVNTRGCADNYSGIRIAKGGRRFMICNATVWNLIDGDGRCRGQAAVIREWRPLA
jgi:hypothetical protein